MSLKISSADKVSLIKLASVLPQGSSERKQVLKFAREFATEESLKKYLKDHPNADPKKHSVKKKDDSGSSSSDKKPTPGSLLDVDEKGFADPTPASEAEIEGFKNLPAIKNLGKINLSIIAGDDKKITKGDLTRAAHVAAHIEKGLADSADYCKVNPPACEGNLGITRDNMPQVMEKPVKQMLKSDEEHIKTDEFKDKDKKKVSFDQLDEKTQAKLRKGWAEDRKKGQAAVDAGADPNEDRSTQQIWLDSLKDEGIEINEDSIPVGELIASQAEIKAKKSYELARDYITGAFDNMADLPILVARDPSTGETTVIDGHHRYAGLLTADPKKKMKVRVIEAPIRDALERSFNVPGVFRADLQDNIVDPNQPLDLARKPGTTWQQKDKWYAKNKKKETGGPFESKEAADNFAKGKKGKGKKSSSLKTASASERIALIRLASSLPKGSAERKALLAGISMVKTSSKGGEVITVGDRVKIQTSRGSVVATVVEVTTNWRARTWPHEIRFTTDDGKDYHGKRKSIEYSAPENKGTVYLGPSTLGGDALSESLARRDKMQDKKEERARSGEDILLDMKLKKGDVILYRYSNALQKEVVAGVNYQTGKVGIERFNEYQKKRYFEILSERKSQLEEIKLFGEFFGEGFLNKRGPSDRSVRWLPASGIEKVLERAS